MNERRQFFFLKLFCSLNFLLRNCECLMNQSEFTEACRQEREDSQRDKLILSGLRKCVGGLGIEGEGPV